MKPRQTKETVFDQAGVDRLGAMLPSPDCQIAMAANMVKNAWIIVPVWKDRDKRREGSGNGDAAMTYGMENVWYVVRCF